MAAVLCQQRSTHIIFKNQQTSCLSLSCSILIQISYTWLCYSWLTPVIHDHPGISFNRNKSEAIFKPWVILSKENASIVFGQKISNWLAVNVNWASETAKNEETKKWNILRGILASLDKYYQNRRIELCYWGLLNLRTCYMKVKYKYWWNSSGYFLLLMIAR
jgi:uncharacterized protein with PQ loop repeat